MPLSPCITELRSDWLPHITDSGIDRIIALLEEDSPFLIHGSFTKAIPMGCLASHIAWHHPYTESLNIEAGVVWLTKVAHLNPATSKVVRTWDVAGAGDWELRDEILAEFRAERARRQHEGADHINTIAYECMACN